MQLRKSGKTMNILLSLVDSLSSSDLNKLYNLIEGVANNNGCCGAVINCSEPACLLPHGILQPTSTIQQSFAFHTLKNDAWN